MRDRQVCARGLSQELWHLLLLPARLRRGQVTSHHSPAVIRAGLSVHVTKHIGKGSGSFPAFGFPAYASSSFHISFGIVPSSVALQVSSASLAAVAALIASKRKATTRELTPDQQARQVRWHHASPRLRRPHRAGSLDPALLPLYLLKPHHVAAPVTNLHRQTPQRQPLRRDAMQRRPRYSKLNPPRLSPQNTTVRSAIAASVDLHSRRTRPPIIASTRSKSASSARNGGLLHSSRAQPTTSSAVPNALRS